MGKIIVRILTGVCCRRANPFGLHMKRLPTFTYKLTVRTETAEEQVERNSWIVNYYRRYQGRENLSVLQVSNRTLILFVRVF